VQSGNKDGFLSLDFGLSEFGMKDEEERLRYYRRFFYDMGALSGLKKERQEDVEIGGVDRFRYRTRYFTDRDAGLKV
jgi:hypothetical protein